MSSGSNGGMEMVVPLVNAIINNALLRSNSRINQMLPQIIHFLHVCLTDLLPHIL